MASILSFHESSINPVLVSLGILLLVRSLIAFNLVMVFVDEYSRILELTEANLVPPCDRDLQRILSPAIKIPRSKIMGSNPSGFHTLALERRPHPRCTGDPREIWTNCPHRAERAVICQSRSLERCFLPSSRALPVP